MQWYSSMDEPFYLGDINATLYIHRYLVGTISNLIDERYQSIWIETNPLGNDFLRLLMSLQRLTNILAQVLTNDCEQFPGCSLTIHTNNIDQTIQILNRQQLDAFAHENHPTQTKITFNTMKKTSSSNKTVPNIDDKHNGRHSSS
jgi:hypothetical protein